MRSALECSRVLQSVASVREIALLLQIVARR